jgi:hypothetical protein
MRRDSLGRRIGANPWREYVMDAYGPARLAWEALLEESSSGYATEEGDFRRDNPGPTLKGFLLQLRGTW